MQAKLKINQQPLIIKVGAFINQNSIHCKSIHSKTRNERNSLNFHRKYTEPDFRLITTFTTHGRELISVQLQFQMDHTTAVGYIILCYRWETSRSTPFSFPFRSISIGG